MKFNTNLAKTIAIITLAALLTFSIFFNIFITTILEIKDIESFKQVLLCRELINSMEQLPEADNNDISNAETSETLDSTLSDTEASNAETSNTEIKDALSKAPAEDTIIYNENGIKVIFVGQELGLMGPSLKFYIENNTDQTLDICLTDTYIDGFKADLSSLYCSELAAGKKTYESLTLWESDYKDFTSFPSVVQFVVKIQDSESWHIIAEAEYINLCLN